MTKESVFWNWIHLRESLALSPACVLVGNEKPAELYFKMICVIHHLILKTDIPFIVICLTTQTVEILTILTLLFDKYQLGSCGPYWIPSDYRRDIMHKMCQSALPGFNFVCKRVRFRLENDLRTNYELHMSHGYSVRANILRSIASLRKLSVPYFPFQKA